MSRSDVPSRQEALSLVAGKALRQFANTYGVDAGLLFVWDEKGKAALVHRLPEEDPELRALMEGFLDQVTALMSGGADPEPEGEPG